MNGGVEGIPPLNPSSALGRHPTGACTENQNATQYIPCSTWDSYNRSVRRRIHSLPLADVRAAWSDKARRTAPGRRFQEGEFGQLQRQDFRHGDKAAFRRVIGYVLGQRDKPAL